jgi:hypothetical protein
MPVCDSMGQTPAVDNLTGVFYVHVTCIVTNFFVTKSTRWTNFTNLSRNSTCFGQLERCLQTCMTYTIAECTVNKLLMMDRRTVRNM